MPLFLNKNIFFIHIPKTGGSSIERFISDNGGNMSLYGGDLKITINGHTPQHMTFKEIEKLKLNFEDLKFFTVIRDPIDRTISEFFYIKKHRKKTFEVINNFDEFLDMFLDLNNSSIFDNHNLSNYDYLLNNNNELEKNIKIFNFLDINSIEDFLGFKGLSNYHLLKNENSDLNITEDQVKRIKSFFDDDYRFLFKK